jgi:hypothetical protein
VDETTWGALAVVLTLLGGGYTYWAFLNRGAKAGTRGAALTLLPAAAWLTGTLKMFTRIVDAVVDWATSIVLSPPVWLGVGLAGLAFVLFVIAGFLPSRSGAKARSSVPGGAQPKAVPPAPKGRQEPILDDGDDLADIEAILRKRGIT